MVCQSLTHTMGDEMPLWRVSRNWDGNGVIAMKWSRTRGYVQNGPVFLTVADARAYISGKAN